MKRYVKKIGVKQGDLSKGINFNPRHYLSFYVEEWHDGTPDEIKNAIVLWNLLTPDGVMISTQTQHDGNIYTTTTPYNASEPNDNMFFRFSVPLKYCNTVPKEIWCLEVKSILNPAGEPFSCPINLKSLGERLLTKVDVYVGKDGTPIEPQKTLRYGDRVSLRIETEGMCGSEFCIFIYEKETNRPVYRYKASYDYLVKCKDGTLEFRNIPTTSWRGGSNNGTTSFVIKIVDETDAVEKEVIESNFITNRNDKTKVAYTLSFDNKQENNVKPDSFPDNTSLTTVQGSETIVKRYEHCLFSKFSFKVGDEPLIPVFNEKPESEEEKEALKALALEANTRTFEFAFDKANLTNNSKEELRKYIEVLKRQKQTVLLDGYADSRGSNAYNYNLSVERVANVAQFMIDEGIPAASLKVRAHGKTNQPKEDAKTEADHQKNRVVNMQFTLMGFNPLAKTHSIVSHNPEGMLEQVTVSIENYIHTECLAEPLHKENLIITKILKDGPENDLIHSPVGFPPFEIKAPYLFFQGFSDIFNYVSANHFNEYRFRLNTCAYYPKEGAEVLHLKVFPDTQFLYHGFLDSADMNYRIGKHKPNNVPLHTVLQLSKDQVATLLDIYLATVPVLYQFLLPYLLIEDVREFIVELVQDMLNTSLENYRFGVHSLYNFTNEKVENKDHTNDYKEFFGNTAIFFAILYVIIEIVIIIFTGGSKAAAKVANLEAKIAKHFEKLNKIAKKIPGLNLVGVSLDLDFAKVTSAAQMQYELHHGRMLPVYAIELGLDPLIGISASLSVLDFKVDLNSNKKSVKGVLLDKIVEWLGKAPEVIKGKIGISMKIELSGQINSKEKIKFSYADGKFFSLLDETATGTTKSTESSIGLKISIEIDAMKALQGVKLSLMIMPTTAPLVIAADQITDKSLSDYFDANGKANLSGKIGLVSKWNVAAIAGPELEAILNIHPIYGQLEVNVGIKKQLEYLDEGDTTDESNDNGHEVWGGMEIPIIKIPLLSLFTSKPKA